MSTVEITYHDGQTAIYVSATDVDLLVEQARLSGEVARLAVHPFDETWASADECPDHN